MWLNYLPEAMQVESVSVNSSSDEIHHTWQVWVRKEHGPENQTGLGGKARSARLPGLQEEVLLLPMLGWR